MIRMIVQLAAVLLVHGASVAQQVSHPPTMTIRELVREEGHGRTQLRGIAIVTGLNGTGDSGNELPLARPLAEWYRNNGNPIENLEDLAKAKSAAIVAITCEVPEGGARVNDLFDVRVSVLHSATSLAGGELQIAPLLGPLRGQGVYAFASGTLIIEDPATPTVARIFNGGQMTRDIRMNLSRTRFNLVLREPYRTWQVAQHVADEINGLFTDLESDDDLTDPVAEVLDQMTVAVTVPAGERQNPSKFMADVLSKRFSPTLLDLPAMVVVNERTGVIVVTGDVEISAVTVESDTIRLQILDPPSDELPEPRLVERRGTEFGTTGPNRERTRIQALLSAFQALDVPTREKISILRQLSSTGRLHGDFKVDR